MTPGQAHREVFKAKKEGRITRPDACELCGSKGRTGGHHYNGYDKPLDVWYICYSCNSQLRGYHDGSLTQEQARELIALRKQAAEWKVASQSKKNPDVWYLRFQGTETQARKRYQYKAKRMNGVALLAPNGEVVDQV